MRVMSALMALLAATSIALADPPFTAPTTQPAAMPKNIEKALDENVAVKFTAARLEDAVATLRQATHTNIAVNWPALALAGITRDTPVTLHLANLTYEQTLRALLEQLPTTQSHPNFLVGDNAVEITTTAELGKLTVIRVIDLSQILPDSITGPATDKQLADHAEFLKQIVHSELTRAGEDVDGAGRSIVVKNDHMIVTESRRAQLFARHAIQLFTTPVRVGEHAPGTLLSVQEKKAQQQMNDLVGHENHRLSLATIAADPAKNAPDLNLVILPDAAAELAKPNPDLDYAISASGIVTIGPQPQIRDRTILAVYDLRDILKRMALRNKQTPPPTPNEFTATLLAQLKSKVPAAPEKDAHWTDFDKSPTSMTLYEYLLVVSAPPATHRALTTALQDLHRQ